MTLFCRYFVCQKYLKFRQIIKSVCVILVAFFCVGISFRYVFALTESTLTFPANINFNSSGYDNGLGSVTVSAEEISLSQDSNNWWNESYLYKKQLTVKNISGGTITANTPYEINLNTKELFDATKLKSNCEDLRVVYSQTSGSHTELSRSYYVPGDFANCADSTNTTIAFPLQADLADNSSSNHYYIYYGNSSATDPNYGDNGYSIGDADATLVCPFNDTTKCVDGETPVTQTGAIRYSGGKSALSFDGVNDYVDLGNSSTFDFGDSTDFTIEGYFYLRAINGYRVIVSKRQSSGIEYVVFYYGGKLYAALNSVQVVSSTTVSTNTWYHFAVVFDRDANLVLYLNGNLDGTPLSLSSAGSATNTGNLYLGAQNGNYFWNGLIDEVRISNIARYTSNFTPQTTPFEPDEHTKLLLHFDENGDDPRNSRKAIDSSGNGNHGTIYGAKYVSGLVGVDATTSDTGNVLSGSTASKKGVFIEEGTTNVITNPSFEHSTFDTNWGRNYFNFSSSLATFTPNMAKRNSEGPFAAGVLVQEEDILSITNGTQITGNFYSNFDTTQGSVVLWWTPEYSASSSASGLFYLWYLSSNHYFAYDYTNSRFELKIGGQTMTASSTITAGTTYNLVARWDTSNSLDGTNYASISINDNHTFGITSQPTVESPASTIYIGTNGVDRAANGIIEGLTVFRRVLYDGSHGIDAGNGDEINQIYNSGTGKDPTLITGSWDVVFALPTNASTGTLTSGTGNAWSHPHASNLLYTSTTNTGGFMMNGTYTNDGWSDFGTPTSVSALATSEKIFAGGYKFTTDAAEEGIKYSKSGLSVGQDFVIRALAHSDGTSIPKIQIWDANNNHEITQLTGIATSSRTHPDVLLFTFELPYVSAYNPNDSDGEYDWVDNNCTNIEIRLINANGTGAVYWHQIEILDNKISNPSFEVWSGDPLLPVGWSKTSYLTSGEASADTGLLHSGNYSLNLNTNSNNEGIVFSNASDGVSVGEFLMLGLWGKYQSGPGEPILYNAATKRQDGYDSFPGRGIYLPSVFGHKSHVYIKTSPYYSSDAVNYYNSAVSYWDDVYKVKLLSVNLTVSSSSQSNSTETSGLRIDGADTLSQVQSAKLKIQSGVAKFKFTPRHNFADAAKFGIANPVIFHAYYDASNYLKLYYQSATVLRLTGVFSGTTVNADWSSPTLNAGTTYNMEVAYTAGGALKLAVDGTQRASATGVVAFASEPASVYLGHDNTGANQYDCTISDFTTLTPTENTNAPYYKFGSKSAKLVNAGTMADEYTISINPGNTSAHTLSAYVYDGTTGNVGGTVSASVAKLVFNGLVVTPSSYTDMGGGWWRLSYSTATANQAGLYGVQVMAGKTVYVDGVQLEPKSYATTYADGSLGNGYSWSGTSNASSSIRSTPNFYFDGSNVNKDYGALSFWWKPEFDSDSVNSSANRKGIIGSNIYLGEYFALYYNEGKMFLLHPFDGNSTVMFSKNFIKGEWLHIVAFWDGLTASLTVNNSTPISNSRSNDISPSSLYFADEAGNQSASGGYGRSATISDLRIYNRALSTSEVASLYYQGLATHQSGSESDDRYVSTGTYTSPVIDLGAIGAWGATPFTVTQILNGGTINYFTRTSMDNNTWGDWTAVSGSTIGSNAYRYLQWKVNLAPSDSPTGGPPKITQTVFAYVEDSTAPVNSGDIALGYSTNATVEADLITDEWYNYPTPKFTWDSSTDNAAEGQSASGVNGYHVLLTPNNDLNPSEQINDNCYAYVSEASRQYIVGTTNSNCILSDNDYYLLIQSQDNSGNISTTSQIFTYRYDGTNPNPPSSVSSTVVGYTSTNSFSFYWPSATDPGSNPSGIAYYEYKTAAESSTWSPTNAKGEIIRTEITGIQAYQEGQNYFFVRSVDNAGNVSSTTSNIGVSSFYYNSTAPTAPLNLTITPNTSSSSPASSNVFTVTWDPPESFSGDILRYYYCVNCVPSSNNMTSTSASETVNRTITNSALATQQGENTFYIVAEDNNINSETGQGNINYGAYASIKFYTSTTAPGAPRNLTASDASNRDSDTWRVTLAWEIPSGGGIPNNYKVYRSTNDNDYSLVGETTSTAYTDAELEKGKTYYYKVYAVDNAGSMGTSSDTVKIIPEGKYADPPSAGGTPSATPGSTTAIIKWTTDRLSYGSVEYGKSSDFGSSASESIPTTDHSVKISGLAPGTKYFYRVLSMDDSNLVGYARDEAYSSTYSFTTLQGANISDVTVTDLTLESAVINWKTASLASSKVEYGTTSDYGKEIVVSTTADESTHSARLTGLDNSIVYHFRIRGITADEDDIFSEDYTFQTLTMPKITAVVFKTGQDNGVTSAMLAFATNVPTTSEVYVEPVDIDFESLTVEDKEKIKSYYPEDQQNDIDYSKIDLTKLKNMRQEELASLPIKPSDGQIKVVNGEKKTRHLVTIPNLADGKMYIFNIKGYEEHGYETSSDPIRYITGSDVIPPKISNVLIETPVSNSGDSKGQIIVSFDTDEETIAEVDWGVGTGDQYQNTQKANEGFDRSHIIVLRDLDLTSTYHLKIKVRDKIGNQSESEDLVVVTPTPVRAAFDVIIDNLEDVFGFLRL